MCKVISKALLGFFKILFANFSPALAERLSQFLIKLTNPSAFMVLSEAVINFSPLQIEQGPIYTLLALEVTSNNL